ncbi:hypothetical protein C9278_26805 (plasmid) [Escherichia coli]|nr:hypothetical protein C9278_26805 [Escherichia coli]
MHHRTPLRFLAHSLATLGHETAASATTTHTETGMIAKGGFAKRGVTPKALRALLSDKAICTFCKVM